MKILFANFSGLKFDILTPEVAPLGGTESCVCYLARKLAQRNHQVFLAGNCEEKDIAGVKHFPVSFVDKAEFFTSNKFDVIVVPNAAIVLKHIKQISPGSKLVFWSHMAFDQPSLEPLAKDTGILQFVDVIVYVSNWQRIEIEKKFGFSKKFRIIGNGLTPAFERLFDSFEQFKAGKKFEASYSSTPFRGLQQLVAVHQSMLEKPLLHVFSSMKVYQQADRDYEQLYKQMQQDSTVRYHGSVSQVDLAKEIRGVSFFPYPCTFAETYCIAAIEAMAVGAKVITTDLGALRTTTMGYAELLPHEVLVSPAFLSEFKLLYERVLQGYKNDRDEFLRKQFGQVQDVNRNCTWDVRVKDWERLFFELTK